MCRLLIRIILPIIGVFTTLISLVRLQPYQAGDLDYFLHSTNACEMPCWEGIRPGVTTARDAIGILQNHPWIGDVVVYNRAETSGSGFIRWRWSGRQPAIINSSYRGNLLAINGVVQTVTIPTAASFGEIWLLMDHHPGKGMVSLSGVTTGRDKQIYRAAHQAIYEYPQGILNAYSVLTCPLQPASFWRAKVDLHLGNNSNALPFVQDYDLARWFLNQPVCE
jgi:hypothetical protein